MLYNIVKTNEIKKFQVIKRSEWQIPEVLNYQLYIGI